LGLCRDAVAGCIDITKEERQDGKGEGKHLAGKTSVIETFTKNRRTGL